MYVCVCVFLPDVKQDMLETIVPKGDNESIMVVLGEQRGQVSRSVQVCLLSFLLFLNFLSFFCCSRWAVFFSGTRTNAERWFSSTDTRRKCSRWTTTPFVTMLEIIEYRNFKLLFL